MDNNGVCAQTDDGLIDWEYPNDGAQNSLGYYLDTFNKNGWISPAMSKSANCGIQSSSKWKDTTSVRATMARGPMRVYYKL